MKMELATAAAAQNTLNRANMQHAMPLVDSDSARVLSQIYDKLADIDQKLNFVTEVLVNSTVNNNNPNHNQLQHQQQQLINGMHPLLLAQSNLNSAAQMNKAVRETSVIVPTVNGAAGNNNWMAGAGNNQVPTPPALPVATHNAMRKRAADGQLLLDIASQQQHQQQDRMKNDWLANVLNDSIALAKRIRAPGENLLPSAFHHTGALSGGMSLPTINRDDFPENNAAGNNTNLHLHTMWNGAAHGSLIGSQVQPESTTNNLSDNGDDQVTTSNVSSKTEQDDSSEHTEHSNDGVNDVNDLVISDEQQLSPPQTLPRAHSERAPSVQDGPLNAQLGVFGKYFSGDAIRRAIEKAARSFDSTKPKVFAWQLLRESVTDAELPRVHISLRTFQGETADDLLNRQLAIVRNVVLATLTYFNWEQLPFDQRLVKTKIVLSHLKNNTKVRNWTLREGKSHRDRNSPEVLWRRYAAMLGPAGLAAAGLIATPDSSTTGTGSGKPDSPPTPSSTDSP